jgi:hypothetical protein
MSQKLENHFEMKIYRKGLLSVTNIKSDYDKIIRTILSNRGKCSIGVIITVTIMLIIGGTFPNMALSNSSSQIPSGSCEISGSSSNGSAPNLNGIHD